MLRKEEELSPTGAANQLQHDIYWANAGDHNFCKKCKPHALQLMSLVARGLHIIERLRGIA